MKIIHVANFNISKAGTAYYSTDRKLSSGLIRNGHFVYDFSYRDIARANNKFGSKQIGTGSMNRQLLETVYNIEPDLLLIGHSEIVWNETLREIKKILPNIIISMWYVDALYNDKNLTHIYECLESIDNIYCTTGGELLFKFKREHNNVFYIPNPIDSSIETLKNDERNDFPIDLLFCGTDQGGDERSQIVRYLQEHLHDINFSIYGSLGNPPIYGNNYIKALSDSRIGLNLSRRNNIFLYSSDRIAQLTGNGILTFTPDTPGMRELYTDEEVVYFSSQHELMEKVKHYKTHDNERIKIARNGRLKSHDKFSSTAVARFITNTSTGIESEPFYNHKESSNNTNSSKLEDEVLVIRFSSLGDLAVMEPAFRAIRHFHPNSKITFVSSQIGYELYYGSPHFDNFIIDNYPHNKLLSRTYHLYRNLRMRKYSIVYNLQGSSVSHLLTSILHKDKLINQSSSRLQKL
ncbi:MAG: glycosyltransferase, partial [Nitrosopumilus sp.]|nr:glycosyltransferase [Nitrosopumilus sp.]